MKTEVQNARHITKPIQLWAAWLIGLTTVVGIFLGAATQFPSSWERSALVVAAILYVPGFLLTMVILQTRFRAELQEDSYYSQMVTNRKTDMSVAVSRLDTFESKIEMQMREFLAQAQATAKQIEDHTVKVSAAEWDNWKVALNTHHPAYKSMKLQLEKEKIPVLVAFGADKAPKKWIVSINESMPTPLALQILTIASKFAFDGFVFWTPIREVGETEDVYIGSYGIGSYIQFEPSFAESIKDEFGFSEYMLKNQKGGRPSKSSHPEPEPVAG